MDPSNEPVSRKCNQQSKQHGKSEEAMIWLYQAEAFTKQLKSERSNHEIEQSIHILHLDLSCEQEEESVVIGENQSQSTIYPERNVVIITKSELSRAQWRDHHEN
jgi:hypothetical protein